MNFRSMLLALPACLMLCLGACNDVNDFPDTDIQLYQQYEVFIQDGSKAGFANFYVGSQFGERYQLKGDAKVYVNNTKMMYTPTVSSTYPEFNYASYIDNTNNEATFRLRRSKNTTLTNSIKFDDIAYVKAEENFKNIKLGENYPYTIVGNLKATDEVRVSLVLSSGTADAKIFKGEVNSFNKTFTIKDVPAGTYNVRLDVYRTQSTAQNDGVAGGTIRVIRRKTVYEVKVAE